MKHIQFSVALALFLMIIAFTLFIQPTFATGPVTGGVLRFPNVEPGTLDPALLSYSTEVAIAQQIFDGLTQFDPDGNLAPAIASAWSVSPDVRTFTFTLRSDAYFHNGRQVKAGDFVYSWNRASSLGGGYADIFSNVYTFTALSDFVFRVTLTNTQSSFLSYTTLPIFFVIPSENASTIGTQPVGTGPFKFVSWTPGASGKIVLQANPTYYGGTPYLARVEYKFYPTIDSQWADFQAKNLEVSQIPTTTWNSVKTDPNVITESIMMMYGFGIDNAAFPDVNVRRAFQQAVDRVGIVTDPTVSNYGALELAHGVVSPGKGTYDNSDINISYNPTNSLSLLAAAGWTDTNHDGILDNGTGTNLTILLYGSNTQVRQRIVNDLSNIGGKGAGALVSVTTTVNAPGIKMRISGWYSDIPDPENDLLPYVTNGLVASRLHYNSAIFNAFYNSGQASLDINTRNAAFHLADYQVVITDATWAPIYYGAMTPVMKKPYVNGLQYSHLVGHPMAPLRLVWLDLKYLYLPLVLR